VIVEAEERRAELGEELEGRVDLQFGEFERVVEPDPALRDRYRAPLERFRALYARLRPAFAEAAGESR
jgi:hypothetical protein